MTLRGFIYDQRGFFVLFGIISAFATPVILFGILEIPYINWLVAVIPDHSRDTAGGISIITSMTAVAAPFVFAALYGKEDEEQTDYCHACKRPL